MMSGDLSDVLGARRLSVPVTHRRYSALAAPPPGIGAGAGPRRLSAFVPESVVRRLSNVSTTLGLARPSIPECLVEQGKALFALYMRSRIRSAGASVGMGASMRAQTCSQLVQPWAGARLVFPRISTMGRYLERTRPRLFAAIGRHVAPGANAVEPIPDPADVVYGMGTEMLKEDITWGKIVALMAVCGAIASEPRANPDLLSILDAAAALIRGYLLPWLTDHGGWYGLLEHCQPLEPLSPQQPRKFNSIYVTATFLILPILLGLLWMVLRDLFS